MGTDAYAEPPPLRLDLPAVPDAAAHARHAVVAYAAPLVADTFGVAMAVQEAVTNSVVHAYRNAEAGRVEVVARPDRAGLHVTVGDHGSGMVPRPDTPGLGLGLPLIAQVTEGFDIEEPAGGGTRLVMHFATSG